MKNIATIFVLLVVLTYLSSSFITLSLPKRSYKTAFFDSIKEIDSIRDTITKSNIKPYKQNVHASYYHDKFNGRRTASGQVFSNSKYTAAHKKLKFGTKVLVTNPINNKSVIVTVNDRGPFVKGREIDLSKKAFMEISQSNNKGSLKVNLDIIQD